MGGLMVALLFVLLAIIAPRNTASLRFSAFVLLVLGTIAAFVAIETGEATAEFALKTDANKAVLDQHSELGEPTRNAFTALTALHGLVLFLPRVSQKAARPAFRTAANVVMLALLAAGSLLEANKGHLGGRLVHELGVRAMWPQVPVTAPLNPDSGI
jgi:uncharacterized membrane protein